MKYMGSKNRIAKHILPIMLDAANQAGITKWVEPFVGGGNVIDKVPDCFERFGYDLNEHVIMAMIDIRDSVEMLPGDLTEIQYDAMRGRPAESISSWCRIACSFAGIFESKLAADKTGLRNYASEAKRNAKKQSPRVQGVTFTHDDYKNLSFTESLIYCDPPYQGTSGYKTGGFDHEHFFEWCREQEKNNIVFLSEYDAPFECVWEGEIKTNFASTRKQATHSAVERLYRVR